ncbi:MULTISPECIES: hypothetical protein [Corynebacterium]|uniref:hypothetical protein n=1 Tax=Corynebacterium TaxID=1716 RepID=UPI001EF34EF3|nr:MULTISPECIES: hypothetical protein [Corynebacterium]MCG7461304.1 hypothetical protein [Corynebacterium sp. ACRPF]MCG7465038.1 hypothetical protein [Corynebacterium sp. ACRPJ]MCG7467885.1 hypothetical protein [Corynebacterium sp. ACRPE]MDV2417327.1 hypothetical protein [Corynebacterium tuberculostearicum]MDV2428646.1 hypothetical protein [Corynebacterium tuberculostearicum]
MFSTRVAGAVLSTALIFPAVAHAQLPPEVEAAIAAPISVPAGQTTTVSLPVPAEANYSGDGWNVSASGTSATITAPADGGQISVPVSAQGMNATLTLVADGSVAQEDIQEEIDGAEGGPNPAPAPDPGSDKPAQGDKAPAGNDAEGGDDRPVPAKEDSNLPVVPGKKPERKPAGEANLDGAEYVNLESKIEGNTITAKMGLKQAYDLYQQFKDTQENDVTLRYLDGEGNIIQGVERDVDASSRTLTLTYPEGEAPDNPFIMQLLRNDGSGAALIVTLQDPNYQSAAENLDERQQKDPEEDGGSHLGWIIGGAAAAVLIALIALVAILKRRSSQR